MYPYCIVHCTIYAEISVHMYSEMFTRMYSVDTGHRLGSAHMICVHVSACSYGDMKPVSIFGKVVGSCCAIAGVLTIGTRPPAPGPNPTSCPVLSCPLILPFQIRLRCSCQCHGSGGYSVVRTCEIIWFKIDNRFNTRKSARTLPRGAISACSTVQYCKECIESKTAIIHCSRFTAAVAMAINHLTCALCSTERKKNRKM